MAAEYSPDIMALFESSQSTESAGSLGGGAIPLARDIDLNEFPWSTLGTRSITPPGGRYHSGYREASIHSEKETGVAPPIAMPEAKAPVVNPIPPNLNVLPVQTTPLVPVRAPPPGAKAFIPSESPGVAQTAAQVIAQTEAFVISETTPGAHTGPLPIAANVLQTVHEACHPVEAGEEAAGKKKEPGPTAKILAAQVLSQQKTTQPPAPSWVQALAIAGIGLAVVYLLDDNASGGSMPIY